MSALKVHHTDTRLLVNAGMRFPTCYASAALLDCDKGRLQSTGDWWQVTCKHCLRLGLRDGRKVGGK